MHTVGARMAQKKEIKRCRPEKAPGRNTSLQATPASLPDARKSGETLGRERERETEKRERERAPMQFDTIPMQHGQRQFDFSL